MSQAIEVAWLAAAKRGIGSDGRFSVRIEGSFEGAHSLRAYFPDGSDEPIHGHSWRVLVELAAPAGGLDEQGIAVDFLACESALRAACREFDHGFINEHPDFAAVNPTTEHICLWFSHRLQPAAESQGGRLKAVTVWEGPSNHAALILG